MEERLLRLSWPAAAVAAVLLTALAFVALPLESWWLRLLIGLACGLAGGAFVRWAMARRAAAAELPEKRAVREAARIVDFTWRDMTLVFANEDVARRVRELNVTAGDESAQTEETAAGEARLETNETIVES